ncbi:hypothetical protein PM8797T_26705 [Gimesia maris DSM 8797]|nr:hypothetical protein PM8797T_26705 [Gimesia maris DSM 8797]
MVIDMKLISAEACLISWFVE